MERRAGAVVAHIGGEPTLQRRRIDPSKSEVWWMKPRSVSTFRNSDFGAFIASLS